MSFGRIDTCTAGPGLISARLRQSSGCQQANKLSNSLYRDLPSGKSAPDEENIFIRDEEPHGYHPQKGCYPDLYNHLFGRIAHMSRNAEHHRLHSWTPRLLFAGGLIGAFGIYVIPALLGHSPWEPERSGFTRSMFPVAGVACFFCCCAAPFFSALRPSMKFAAAFAAAAAFVIMLLIALGISLLVGAPSASSSVLQPKQSIQRMGASRSAQLKIVRQRRLVPTADAPRWAVAPV